MDGSLLFIIVVFESDEAEVSKTPYSYQASIWAQASCP